MKIKHSKAIILIMLDTANRHLTILDKELKERFDNGEEIYDDDEQVMLFNYYADLKIRCLMQLTKIMLGD